MGRYPIDSPRNVQPETAAAADFPLPAARKGYIYEYFR